MIFSSPANQYFITKSDKVVGKFKFLNSRFFCFHRKFCCPAKLECTAVFLQGTLVTKRISRPADFRSQVHYSFIKSSGFTWWHQPEGKFRKVSKGAAV